MTRAEIEAYLPVNYGVFPPVQTHFGAKSYAVPSLAWLQGPFWDFFRQRLFDANLTAWSVRWECRDFARAYAAYALECWATTHGVLDTADDGLAIGEIWFVPDASRHLPPGEGHAVVVTFDDGNLIGIDPQNNQLWTLTPTELASRYFVRF